VPPATMNTSATRVIPVTHTSPWKIASNTDSVNNSALGSIPSKADIAPGGGSPTSGIIFGPEMGSLLLIRFFGTGVDNSTYTGRIWRWDQIVRRAALTTDDPNTAIQWTPELHCAFTITLCGKTGIAGGLIDASHRYADTIAVTTDRGLAPLNTRVIGPGGDDVPAALAIDYIGSPVFEAEITLSGGTATAMNFMYRALGSG